MFKWAIIYRFKKIVQVEKNAFLFFGCSKVGKKDNVAQWFATAASRPVPADFV